MTLCLVFLVVLCGPWMFPLLSIMLQYLQLGLLQAFLFVCLTSVVGGWSDSVSLYVVHAFTRWSLMFFGRL